MKIFLKKNEDRRLNIGHQWIFSNEIERTEGNITNGDVVEIFDSRGKPLGKGFYNKNSLIAYRHLTNHNGNINLAIPLCSIYDPLGNYCHGYNVL